MQEKGIDKLFKQSLSSLEMSPSEDVWAGIENELNALAKRRKRVLLFRRVAVAAVVFFALLLWPWLGRHDPSGGHIARQEAVDHLAGDKNRSTQYEKDLSASAGIDESSKVTVDLNKGITGVPSEPTDLLASGEREEDSGVSSSRETMMVSEGQRPVKDHNMLSSLKSRKGGLLPEPVLAVSGLVMEEREAVSLFLPGGAGAPNQQAALPAKAFRVSVKVGGEYSPTYAFREVAAPTGRGYHPSYSEEGMMTASGGFKVSVQMHRRWSVESGVRYAGLGQTTRVSSSGTLLYSMTSTRGEEVSLQNVQLGNSLGAVRTPDVPKSPVFMAAAKESGRNEVFDIKAGSEVDSKADLKQVLGYVEVPLTLRYRLFEQGVSLSVSGGVSSNWLVTNEAFLYASDQKRGLGEIDGLAKMSMSTHAGVALSVPLFRSLSLQLEPRVSYFISDISEDYPTVFRPYSFGVFTGIFYSIGK